MDATLITAHSEKEKAAGNYKGGYGFHPLQAYADETREALGGLLRPGNAGANTAADHQTVLDRALEQIPTEHIQGLQILVRATPPAPRTPWPTTAMTRRCASRSAMS